MGRYCLIESEMIWDDEKVLEMDTGDGYVILWMDLMPLQTANFMLCIFHHKHIDRSSTHWFNKYILSVTYLPGTMLSLEDVKWIQQSPTLFQGTIRV